MARRPSRCRGARTCADRPPVVSPSRARTGRRRSMAKDKEKRPIIIVRKKKIVAGGHHGGSWKVAYADFVTAMMAFFLVMWIVGMDEQTKQAIEGYFSNP